MLGREPSWNLLAWLAVRLLYHARIYCMKVIGCDCRHQMSGPISEETIPYWNVNIPRSEWTVECPDFLAGAGRGNQQQLGTKDADYTLMTWDELWEIISRSTKVRYHQHVRREEFVSVFVAR